MNLGIHFNHIQVVSQLRYDSFGRFKDKTSYEHMSGSSSFLRYRELKLEKTAFVKYKYPYTDLVVICYSCLK